MAKVIMTCGRICCGKTTYAQKLREERNAVILSIDEITLTLFPEGAVPLFPVAADPPDGHGRDPGLGSVDKGTAGTAARFLYGTRRGA